jgi:TPP-dependent trihydroxycyclohexane-1,2-dione (THcHDO) dehydratase
LYSPFTLATSPSKENKQTNKKTQKPKTKKQTTNNKKQNKTTTTKTDLVHTCNLRSSLHFLDHSSSCVPGDLQQTWQTRPKSSGTTSSTASLEGYDHLAQLGKALVGPIFTLDWALRTNLSLAGVLRLVSVTFVSG